VRRNVMGKDVELIHLRGFEQALLSELTINGRVSEDYYGIVAAL